MPDLRSALTKHLPAAQSVLLDLIRLQSTPGDEREVMDYLADAFAKLAPEVERVPIPPDIGADPDYSDPVPDLTYDGHFNVRVRLPGSGGGKTVVFNTHADVVPASQGQERPFDPTVQDGVVYGRGACDAKGQIAALYLLLSAFKEVGTPPGDVILHLVVEEEVGGNGSLAMVRRGEKADACIVMEPTAYNVFSSVRGAVWFRVVCHGRAGHSGRAGDTVSALKMAVRVMQILEGYHARLLAASKGLPLFDRFPNPMPITFGKLRAGDWPATAPSQAVLEGVLGLLPNKTWKQVTEEMRQALLDEAGDYLRDHFDLTFMYRHDAHVLDPNHPLVTELLATCHELGLLSEVTAMTASCDSWLYNNQLGIPTVVFGVGTLKYAHSNQEQIALEEIRQGAEVLGRFLQRWGSQ
jgi:acetylornithine deacetylase